MHDLVMPRTTEPSNALFTPHLLTKELARKTSKGKAYLQNPESKFLEDSYFEEVEEIIESSVN